MKDNMHIFFYQGSGGRGKAPLRPSRLYPYPHWKFFQYNEAVYLVLLVWGGLVHHAVREWGKQVQVSKGRAPLPNSNANVKVYELINFTFGWWNVHLVLDIN